MILAEELLIYMRRNGFLGVMNLTSISLFAWIHSSNSSFLEACFSGMNDNKLP